MRGCGNARPYACTMSSHTTPERFFADLASFSKFEELTEDRHFVPLPEDWFVVITDVRGSTRAIEAGRYRDVNTIGAASISVVQEAIAEELPFVFGGDGATILVPPTRLDAALEALTGLAALARENFDLELRVGRVAVRELDAAGTTIEVAKHELAAGRCIAVMRGGGLAKAEQLVKGDEATYGIPTQSAEPKELKGLTCRWQPIASRRGTMLSLLVEARGDRPREVYAEVLKELARVFGGNLDVANPVEPETMRYKSLVSIVRDEWRQTARLSWRSIYARLFSIFASVLMFALRIKPMGYDPEPYRKAMRTHSDFRKFDGVLRMVIDCTDEEKAHIVAMLEASAARGQLAYGVHGSRTALMTCYVRGMSDGQHIHFIDGANGGYAMAAKGLKAQRG